MVAPVVKVGHSYDGPRWTVSQMVHAPTRIPQIVVAAVKDNLIADLLLRQGPPAPGGAVQYEERVIFSSDRSAEIIAEFGEIPTTSSNVSMPMMAATQKRGIGVKISKEMETRNDIGRVGDEIGYARDEMVNAWNKVFFAAISANLATLSMNAANLTGGWTSGTTSIRKDLSTAMYTMANQTVQGALNNDRYGFKPDTLVIHPIVGAAFLDNDEINKVFDNSPATTISPRYTLAHPKKFGQFLDIVESWECPQTKAYLLQRKKFGFISDEWPLSGSPTKYVEREQSYSTYFTRRALVAIDQPKSIITINNI